MNYRDVYFSRVNHFGNTIAERMKNSGIVAFEKWMAQSPFTVINLSVERGYYFSGIIETSKDREEKKIMYLYVANDIPIKVGDILTWRQDNGAIEKWLLLQQIHKVHPTYQTFQIIKCNYELKWIDFSGYLRKSWAYAVSSVDSKVKSNFRMWHSLISPQPNKYAEVIMPRPLFEDNSEDLDRLMRGITFIIENEGWTIIECDWTSVEGIAYMSLTESKVNYQYDDRVVDVAELDRLKFPILEKVYAIGEEIVPHYTQDTFNEWETVLIPSEIEGEEPYVALNNNNHWQAIRAGQFIMKMRLKNYNAEDPKMAVTKEFEITITEASGGTIYLQGADEVRLDRYETYSLMDENTNNPITLAADDTIEFIVENKTAAKKQLASLVTAYDANKNIIPYAQVLHANANNELGEVVLTAIHKNGNNEIVATYTKTVKIIPLW